MQQSDNKLAINLSEMLFVNLFPLGDLVTSRASFYVLSAYLVGVCGGSNQLDHIYDSYPTKSSLPENIPISPHPQFVYSHSGKVTAGAISSDLYRVLR